MLTELFEQFVKERKYLKNVTPKTVIYYRNSWDSFSKFVSAQLPEDLSRALLNQYVVQLRESGIKPVSCNTYISGINAFLAWLHESGHTAAKLSIKKLKVEQQVVKTVEEESIRAILSFKPHSFGEYRIQALLCLLIDTGIRIEEALTLETEAIDLNNLVLKVMGKGQKERLVPFSYELRRVLVRYMQRLPQKVAYKVFCTRDGSRLSYHNLNRDYGLLCSKLHIEKQGSFHRLRHTFATNYVRSGGNILYLSRVLGHTTLQMTKRYVGVEVDALREAQMRTSLMSRLR
jgi:integrase/recombinase XerD